MKKDNIRNYSKALAEVAMGKKIDKKSAENFLALLKKAGLERKAKQIVELAEQMILEKKGNKKIVFETARPVSLAQKKILHAIAKPGDIVKEKINPDLIAGVKIVVNEQKQFDMSLAKKLQEIF